MALMMTTWNRVTLLAALVVLFATPARAETALEKRVNKSKQHHLRMSGELAAVFAIGHEWYWRDNGSANVVDWQLGHGTAAINSKLDVDGWRFDGNPYDINALGHPGFGTLIYFLGRENGYSPGTTFLISTLASGTWEMFLELREYGSLNDLAMTSPAGVPLGEAAYQMIHHARETRFQVGSGAGVENGASFGVVDVQGDLDRIPTTGDGRVPTGQHVSFAVEAQGDTAGLRSVEGGAKSTLAGFYRNRNGNRLVVAASAEFNYLNRTDRAEREWDLNTTMSVGPSIDYRMQLGSTVLEVGADAYLDFGLLKSEAFDSWRTDHPMDKMRNTLEGRARPYYYAVGATVDPRVRISHGRYAAGAKLVGSLFSSIDGADRDSEMMTTSLHMSDKDARGEAWVGYRRNNMSVVLDGRAHHRSGHANDTTATTGERSATLTVGYSL